LKQAPETDGDKISAAATASVAARGSAARTVTVTPRDVDVADSSRRSSPPDDFSTVKVEAIIEPVPKIFESEKPGHQLSLAFFVH
jgi:hypothetical protein